MVRCSSEKSAVRVTYLNGLPVEGPGRATSKRPHCSVRASFSFEGRDAAPAKGAGRVAAMVAVPSFSRFLRFIRDAFLAELRRWLREFRTTVNRVVKIIATK